MNSSRFAGFALFVCLVAASTNADARSRRKRTHTQTEYPIVLVHGVLGFDKLFGVVDYWYGIPSALRRGGAEVFLAEVSPLNGGEVRGEQLLSQVETVVAVTGKGKVNLIAHSYGALDVRYVAGVRPDLVASVTTIAGPHGGADFADFLEDNVSDGSFTEKLIATFAEVTAKLIAFLSGANTPQDALAALADVTKEGAEAFTERFPAGVPTQWCGEGAAYENGIHYFSWSGVARVTHLLDPLDALFAVSSLVYDGPNDGLIGRCSSHFGRVIRDDYYFNHGDEVNHLLGLTSWFETNPVTLFRNHANRLKNLGL